MAISENAYWVWLQRGIGIGNNTLHILSQIKDTKLFYEAGSDFWESSQLFKPSQLERLKAYSINAAQKVVDEAESNNYRVVTANQFIFPKLLKNINDCPVVLYVMGDVGVFNNSLCISFVGTRQASGDSVDVTSRLCYSLAKSGITIVSGGAFGIDTAAHFGAIEAKGKTVLVRGTGFSSKPMNHQTALFKKILSNGGAVVTEYPLDTSSRYGSFLIRNRIISGLSEGTVIVEAGEKSGALNTANHAKAQNRMLFAIPGSLTAENQGGIQKLLKNGAEIVFSPKDITKHFEEKYSGLFNVKAIEDKIPEKVIDPYDVPTKLAYDPFAQVKQPTEKPEKKEILPDISMLSEQESEIFNYCTQEKSVDEISEQFNIPIPLLSTVLLNMQLTGHLVSVAGNKYKINQNGR